MNNPLHPILNWLAKNFKKNPSKMLIITGVAGWTLSSIAQIGAILVNPKISKEQKSFLVPQEFADAATNILLFFIVTLAAKETISKLFSTGKFTTKSTQDFIRSHKELFKGKLGKIDFNIEPLLTESPDTLKNFKITKGFYETVATVGGGVVSSNILTPLIRNNMASKMQKNYINYNQNNVKNDELKKPEVKLQSIPPQPVFKSYGMRI